MKRNPLAKRRDCGKHDPRELFVVELLRLQNVSRPMRCESRTGADQSFRRAIETVALALTKVSLRREIRIGEVCNLLSGHDVKAVGAQSFALSLTSTGIRIGSR